MSFLSAWITIVFPPDIIRTKSCNRVDSERVGDSVEEEEEDWDEDRFEAEFSSDLQGGKGCCDGEV